LSDQIYGDGGNRHREIRQEVVDYMREHASFFALFVEGSGYGETFEEYTNRMSNDGVYGDNAEIVAFSRRYRIKVVIYQSDYMYIIASDEVGAGIGEAHIAYHSWEHYSSVRNKTGPHDGSPNVQPVAPLAGTTPVRPGSASLAPKWKVDVVRRSVTYSVPDEQIIELLDKHDGDIESVVELLITSDIACEDASASVANSLNGKSNSSVTNEAREGLLSKTHGTEKEALKPHTIHRQPKRLTARERKERQKREATERKKRSRNGDTTTVTRTESPSVNSLSAALASETNLRATYI
jgi:hypothetical protein